MHSEFIIVKDGCCHPELGDESQLIRRYGLLKGLSLFESRRAGLSVPSTLLFMDGKADIPCGVIARWKLPLMVRMDYGVLSLPKPLGGIPLSSMDAIVSVSR